jgi:hypothetical protein
MSLAVRLSGMVFDVFLLGYSHFSLVSSPNCSLARFADGRDERVPVAAPRTLEFAGANKQLLNSDSEAEINTSTSQVSAPFPDFLILSKNSKPTDEIFSVTTQILVILSQVVLGNELGEFLITGQFYIRETRAQLCEIGTHITRSKVVTSLPSLGYGCPTTGKRITSESGLWSILACEMGASGRRATVK